jgi:outer membrane autotransporter protein
MRAKSYPFARRSHVPQLDCLTYSTTHALAILIILLLSTGVNPSARAQSVQSGRDLYQPTADGGKGCGNGNGGCHANLSNSSNPNSVKSASNNPGAIETVLAPTNTAAASQPMRNHFDSRDPAHTPPTLTERQSLALHIGQFIVPEMNNGSIDLSSCGGGSIDVHKQAKSGKGGSPDNGGIAASQGSKGTVTPSGHTIDYTPGSNFDATGDSFTYNVTNGAGTTLTPATVTVVVTATPPSITLSNRSGAVNQAFGPVTVSTTTTPIKTYANKTSLPPGLQLENGQIFGTPTQSGVFNVRLTATNCVGEGPEKTVSFAIAPNAAPVISSTVFEGTLGQVFSANIVASNAPILAFGATNLPPGLSLTTASDPATGTTVASIVGTPTQSGIFKEVTLTARNSIDEITQAATITIFPKEASEISVEPSPLVGVWNQPLKGKIIATNPPIDSYRGDDLPPGLAVNPSTGEISGTPTQPGNFKAKFFATNKVNTTGRELEFSIIAPPPNAQSIPMIVKLNQPATLDLKPHLSGHGVNGVVLVDTHAQHGTVAVNGTKVTYSPRRDYFGSDSFAFVALGTGGTSNTATVSVTVEGRPDPSKDANVVGLLGAQSDAARRFSRAQISNFQERLETLHRHAVSNAETDARKRPTPPERTSTDRRSLERSSSATVGVPAPIQTTRAAAQGIPPIQGGADSSALVSSAGQIIESMLPDAASGLFPREMLGTLLGASLNRTLNLSSLVPGGSASTAGTGFWAAGNIGFGDRDASSDRSGFRFRTSGISIGADHRFSDKLVIGLGLGYARDRTEIGSEGTESRARATSLSLYGSYQPPTKNIFIDGLIGYGALDYDTQRFVEPLTEVVTDPAVKPTKHFASANRDGSQLFGSIAIGYQSPRESGFLWSPYARLDLSRNQLDQATETGAGQYALTYFKQSIANADLSLGLRAQWEHELKRGGLALPHIRLEYTHNLKGDDRASIAYADLISGPRYAVPSVADDRNALTLGVGSDFVLCNGANFGIDYQFRHSSGQENIQALQFRLAKELGTPSRSCEASDGAAPPNRHITADAAFTYDGNVTRARDHAGQLADESFSVKGTKELELFKFGRFGLVVSGSLGGEAFRRYSDLDHLFGEVQGELRYPAYSPNIALFARSAVDHHKSELRRGYNYSAGVVLQRNLTQHGLALTAQLAHNARYGKSRVFDLSDNSAQLGISYALNKDLSTGKTDILYFSGEYRLGDTVSTERSALANLNIAEVFVRDDAFRRDDFFTYRFDARTTSWTLGYIRPLGSGHLDLSWAYTQSTPTQSAFAGVGSERYVDNQLKLVYVLHFGTWNRMGRFRAY